MSIETLLNTLTAHQAVIDAEQLDDLNSLIRYYQKDLSAIREEGRNLRIAVVGQMKAGKSSFLNAAFFNQDILPKADTPMTAALTKLSYAEQPSAKVVFYSLEDWQDIESRAQDYHQRLNEELQKLKQAQSHSPFAKPKQEEELIALAKNHIANDLISSLELVEKAKALGLRPADHLGKTIQLETQNLNALAEQLHDYIGAKGRFTPLTKMIELYVDDARLEGLDIIDTPGFNDPVVSRGQTTRRYLGQCDVIFALSSVSQFLSEADMRLIREQLSEAGIAEKAIFVVGTQQDIALRQEASFAKSADSLIQSLPEAQRAGAKVAAMMTLLKQKMTTQFTSIINTQLTHPDLDPKSQRILEELRKHQPMFISAWSWLMSEQFPIQSEDNRYQWEQLCQATGYPFDAQSLASFSNIPLLRKEMLAQKAHKQTLIANKERERSAGVQQELSRRVKEISQGLQQRIDLIQNGNIEQLLAQEQAVSQRLMQGRAKLEDIFDDQITQSKQRFAVLRNEIRAKSNNYARIETRTETTTISYEVSTSRWWNPFSYGSTATRYRTVVTHYADVQDAIENIEKYVHDMVSGLQREIMHSINLQALKLSISQAAMSLFDVGSADFDAQFMLSQINKSLRKLTVPEVDLWDNRYSDQIIKLFGSHRVSESQIGDLREAQRMAIQSAMQDLENAVQQKVTQITTSLDEAGTRLVDTLIQDIQAGLSQLRADIHNKEQVLEHLAQALADVSGIRVSVEGV